MRLPRSRSMRPCGDGESGGVIEAMGGMGSILMLSSVSAPSRVPHVVCELVSAGSQQCTCTSRQATHLGHGKDSVEFDEVVEVAKHNRDRHEAHIAWISQQMWD
jgi:hypothetical protein